MHKLSIVSTYVNQILYFSEVKGVIGFKDPLRNLSISISFRMMNEIGRREINILSAN